MGPLPSAKATSGKMSSYKGVISEKDYETRIIVYAQGIDFHDDDFREQEEIFPELKSPFDFLKKKLVDKFIIVEDSVSIRKVLNENKLEKLGSVRKIGKYTSEKQKVKFVIIQLVSKKDFTLALETEVPPLHVIYAGHSRYGRGACFDTNTGLADEKGNQWENGVKGKEEDSGLFRLGFPYVPVSLKDLAHHEYNFTPCPVENGEPPNERNPPFSRHLYARKGALEKIDLKQVKFNEKLPPINLETNSRLLSSIGKYYGLTIKKERHLLLRAGWEPSNKENDVKDPCLSSPNLGKTELKCMVLCLFSCDTRIHFWDIVRRQEYKGWKKPRPPTEKYAYFTNWADHPGLVTSNWLYHLLTYKKENKFKPWVGSLEYAKAMANNELHNRYKEPPNMIY